MCYAFQGSPVPVVPGCNKQGLQGFKSQSSEKGVRQLCHVQSDAEGVFGFSRLPPGHYRAVPFYQGPQNLKFDLNPKSQDFVVSDGSVVLPSDFQVNIQNSCACLLLLKNYSNCSHLSIRLKALL